MNIIELCMNGVGGDADESAGVSVNVMLKSRTRSHSHPQERVGGCECE